MKHGYKWLQIKDVESYKNGKKIFADLSVEMRVGENIVIVGPNGSGKSSFIDLISRNIYPVVKPGTVFRLFGESNISIWDIRSKVGLVTTDIEQRIPSHIKAINVLLSGFYGTIGIQKLNHVNTNHVRKAEEILDTLFLSGSSNLKFGELSEGERRKLIIGRAVIHNPKVLILDEPTIKLDIRSHYNLLTTISDLCKRGTTLVQVTHRVDTIIKETNRVLFIKDKKFIDDGSKEKLITSEKLSNLFNASLKVKRSNGYFYLLPNQN